MLVLSGRRDACPTVGDRRRKDASADDGLQRNAAGPGVTFDHTRLTAGGVLRLDLGANHPRTDYRSAWSTSPMLALDQSIGGRPTSLSKALVDEKGLLPTKPQ
jgi:hypothetical protein